MLYDVFICHATEDKNNFVRPLAKKLCDENIEVWYDEFSLKLGDSLRQALDKGLANSRYGIIVLSKAFFKKNWPQYELDGLVEKEMKGGEKVILPIWHDVDHDYVYMQSPSLANKVAVNSHDGLDEIASQIIDIVHPNGSPLLVARDYLIDWGETPPVVTDEYWLNVVEASNRMDAYGAVPNEESVWDRWAFPLPSKDGSSKNWGERLAWTAMQLNWVEQAEKIPISPLTKPKLVEKFILENKGLYETCATVPMLAAEYAPQLTIPGFGGVLEHVFKEEYQKCIDKNDEQYKYGCEEYFLRFPSYRFKETNRIANHYFHGGMFGPAVSPYSDAEHLIWLLSKNSNWLPQDLHEKLLNGMAKMSTWGWFSSPSNKFTWESCGSLTMAMHGASYEKKQFRWNKQIKDDLYNQIKLIKKELKLTDSVNTLCDKFIKNKIPQTYIKDTRKIIKERDKRDKEK